MLRTPQPCAPELRHNWHINIVVLRTGAGMNEQVARDVVLVRAIETLDRNHEILSDDDRKYASRSAKELASWQVADSKSAVTADHFLQQRSEQILRRLAERTPAFGAFLQRRTSWKALSFGLPLAALLIGAGVDRRKSVV